MCVCVCANTSAWAGWDTTSLFQTELKKVSNSECPSPKPVDIGRITSSVSENRWIQTFLKGISVMWNAIRFVHNLNLDRRVHFLLRYPLHHHECILSLSPSLSLYIYIERERGREIKRVH